MSNWYPSDEKISLFGVYLDGRIALDLISHMACHPKKTRGCWSGDADSYSTAVLVGPELSSIPFRRFDGTHISRVMAALFPIRSELACGLSALFPRCAEINGSESNNPHRWSAWIASGENVSSYGKERSKPHRGNQKRVR